MIQVACYVHWAGVGGAEDMIIDEITFADRSKINYIFVTEAKSGESVTLDELRALGIPVHRCNDDVNAFKTVYGWNNIQVVHVLSCGDIQPGYQGALDANIPVIDVAACVSYSKGYEKYGIDKVQPVYLCGKHWLHGGGGNPSFRTINGGVNLDKFETRDPDTCKGYWGLNTIAPVVGWFGRFDQFKCPFTFVAICAELQRRKNDFQYIMFGDGVDRGRAEWVASQSHVKIKFAGMTRNKAIAFSAMDVYCFPTWQEAFGRVMVEAMACGTPIVTADYAVCRELCADAAAYVSNERADPMSRKTVEEYCDAIENVLNNPVVSNQMASEGIRRSQYYSASSMAKEFELLYDEMLMRRT